MAYAADRCVPVPQSKSQWAPKNKSIPTDAKILDIMIREGPSGEYGKGMNIWYLGKVHVGKNKFYIAYTQYSFNRDTREIDRLVFFSEDWHYLGDYGEIYYPPVMICGSTLYWAYKPYLGNKVSVGANGPPRKVVLNGESYEFDGSKSSDN